MTITTEIRAELRHYSRKPSLFVPDYRDEHGELDAGGYDQASRHGIYHAVRKAALARGVDGYEADEIAARAVDALNI